jgi:hypothetical protein
MRSRGYQFLGRVSIGGAWILLLLAGGSGMRHLMLLPLSAESWCARVVAYLVRTPEASAVGGALLLLLLAWQLGRGVADPSGDLS